MGPEADNLDQAAELTQQLTAGYIDAVRQRVKPEQIKRPDGTWPVLHCIDCDEDIPKIRLVMGKVRCVDCQGRRERGRVCP